MKSIPVLMCHHVSPAAGFISCTPENFESQLIWLKNNGYASISLSQFADHLDGQKQAKSVVITFDDGYLDNWVYAFPLLKKYGFKAAVFLVTSWVHDGEVRTNTESAVTISELPECPDHMTCESLIDANNSDSVILRWSEIKQMQDSGLIGFHSHTHTHTRWDKIKPENKNQHIMEELQDSKQALIDNLGSCSEHLCWPQGYFDKDYIQVAQNMGFSYLYTTLPFGRNTSSTPKTHIHRFAVSDKSGKKLGKRIFYRHNSLVSPFFNNFKILRNKLR